MRKSLGSLALPFLAVLVGCGNSSAGASAPTFTEVYTTVMQPHGCTAHHAPGVNEDNFLDMSTQAAAYKDLVGVEADGPACGKSGLTRVVAGDASKSLMYLKVSEAKPPCGGQMPLGCPKGFSCLDDADQATIASWINAGAQNN
jgi:hypothetical protein